MNVESARIGVARSLARKLLAECGVKEPPVSVRALVGHLQKGHDLEVFPCEAFSDNLSGTLTVVSLEGLDEDYKRIDFNKRHHFNRQRFTIAHEIGHLVMKTTCSNPHADYGDVRPYEVEANQFAAELLMPLELIKKDLKRRVKIDQLAEKYMVSPEAMGWKIASSGLLTKL